MVELALRTWPGSTIAIPVNQSAVFEQIAQRHGGKVMRTAVDQASLMHTASSSDVLIAADGTGFFIFPRFQPVADGMMAMIMLVQCLAQHQVRLHDVVADLPPIHMVSASVHCAWDSKGAVMRRLQSQIPSNQTQMIDGVKILLDSDQWVLIRPDPDRPLFHVTAEAGSDEQAQALLAEYTGLVEQLIQQRS
jgi:mannose-1-phosphate guanylyltransferase/phosphomannomutase